MHGQAEVITATNDVVEHGVGFDTESVPEHHRRIGFEQVGHVDSYRQAVVDIVAETRAADTAEL